MRGFSTRVRMGAMWAICVMLSLTITVPLTAGLPIMDVTVDQAQKLMQQRAGQKDFVVLDVREKSYLVYCRSGNRSTKAVHAMEQLGFRTLYHMRDGIVGWEKKGLALSRGQ